MQKRPFYQDSLGTNIKKTPKNVAFSLGVDGSGDFTMRLNVNGAKIW
jgi:hypothetical protein